MVDYVIIGAPKCGTSSVFYWLRDHPEICGSKKKETQYFMDRDSSVFRAKNYHDLGLSEYADFFSHAVPGQIKIEATPGYLYQTTALEVFSEELTNTKLIVILRDPVDRLQSVYDYFSQNRDEVDAELTFEQFVDAIEKKDGVFGGNEFLRDAIEQGAYVHYLREWRDKCGEDRIIVQTFQNLRSDPKSFMGNLAKKMGVDPTFYDDYSFEKKNYSYKVKSRFIHKVVINIRSLIPMGRGRDFIKAIYHKVNTSSIKSTRDRAENKSFKRTLSNYYREANAALTEDFGLDTHNWK